MRSFLRWLELRGEISKAPRVPPVRVEEYEPRILSITDHDTVLAHIPDEDRGIFLALAHLGLRPGEARALTVADYRDGWLFVDKAATSKASDAEIRGTKTGKPKRLPENEELAAWIEERIDPARRFRATPLFPLIRAPAGCGRTRRSSASGVEHSTRPSYRTSRSTMARNTRWRRTRSAGVFRSARCSASWATPRCCRRAAMPASPTTR
jgi:integrase